VVERHTIVNDRRVAFSGGPGGIRHEAGEEERRAMREQHMGATSVQQAHFQAARSDRSFYAKNNGGHPQTPAAERPMGFNNNRGNMRAQQPSFNNNRGNEQGRQQYQNQPSRQPQYQNQQSRQLQFQNQPSRQPQYDNRQQPRQYQQPQQRGNYQEPRGNYQQPRGESRPAPQPRVESRPAPQPRVESRPAPQHEQSRPQPQREEPKERRH
jgi:hypothetical protein